MTVISQVALKSLPSAVVAVIVAFPGAIAVTKPLDDTLAILLSLEDHKTDLSVALLGETVAVSWTVWSRYNVADVLLSDIDVANRFTVMLHVALRLVPSDVFAVMTALPVDFAITKPVEDTVATLVLLELHDTDGLEVVLGRTVAVNCNVLSVYIIASDSLSEMEVASCLTVTTHCAVKLLPSSVLTVMVAVPVDFGVTKPSDDTIATAVLLELQETDLSVVVFGRTVAVSCKVLPIYNVADVLLSDIDVASCLTATLQLALRFEPSAVFAVMTAFPADFAVTKPFDETVATLVLLELHVTAGLDVVLGRTVAVNCNVLSVYIVASVSLSEMEVASCLTVTKHCAVRLLPSSVLTVMVAVPVEIGVTRPSDDTVATTVLLEYQETDLSVVVLGRTIAVSCKVLPIYNVLYVVLSDTEVASCLTATLQLALRFEPSAVVAVMTTLPTDFAVTKPFEETVATLVLPELHVTAGFVVVLGRTVAVNCNVLSVYNVASVSLSEIEVAKTLIPTIEPKYLLQFVSA